MIAGALAAAIGSLAASNAGAQEFTAAQKKIQAGHTAQVKAGKVEPCFGTALQGKNDCYAPLAGSSARSVRNEAYEQFYCMAVAHEESTPEEPWVFIAHPFISGNRAWAGFEAFVRKLHSRYGSERFNACAQAVAACSLAHDVGAPSVDQRSASE